MGNFSPPEPKLEREAMWKSMQEAGVTKNPFFLNLWKAVPPDQTTKEANRIFRQQQERRVMENTSTKAKAKNRPFIWPPAEVRRG